MKRKKVFRIVALVLVLIMAFSFIYAAIDALTAKAAVTQAQIDRLREQKKEYDKKRQEIQSRINTIEYEKMTEIAKKSVLDDRIMLTEQEIENINETIASYEVLIGEKEIEVFAAQGREDARLERYKQRVREMEENGVISYLEIIFDSSSFADLLSRIDFVGDIMSVDETLYQRLTVARNETIAAREDLEQTKIELEEEKANLLSKLDDLEVQLTEASALVEKIQASLEAEKDLYNQTLAEADKVQAEINKKVEELKRQQERASAASVKGTGSFTWPVPSNSTVTSGYGTRLHPVYKVYRQHTGVDIAASYGAKIVAADSGTVITSSYNSSYGNYVVVSHGNGKTTLYAHLSSRSVSSGQAVSKGQTVGLAGSTGVSTGPHLHFEVSVNGSRVNPLNYFTSYDYRG
ncbi:MAG: peptidoglycan DD-metalloendopeptidase family protein [Oscillospiraceae bacterium]|jgi:murein DD-endopeptidase MepM/ murein hydrolase activator NlpD|nr:peptidoglycan DD-metalloendopeptidase family protein [Oscillospiraceae bacterium]